jgi:hypothetical protein
MKKLFTLFIFLTTSLLFSQNEKVPKIKISSEKAKQARSLTEIIPSIPPDYTVTYAEYTYFKNGKILQEIAYSNTIPAVLFNNISKGTVINVFIKILQDTKTEKPKTNTIKTKITIE